MLAWTHTSGQASLLSRQEWRHPAREATCGDVSFPRHLQWPQQAPQPDPAGIITGDKTTTADAGGNPFVVAEPTDKTAPDYGKQKQAYDEFQARAAKEPLTMKLADHVGHLRVATNCAWTLNTGYLVLFMRAGFALLTCGLVPRRMRRT